MDGAKTGGVGFFIVLVLVLEDLGSWREWDSLDLWDLCDLPSPTLRPDRPYGSQRSHRVFGRYQRAGCADAV
jgi:hypothetical protein